MPVDMAKHKMIKENNILQLRIKTEPNTVGLRLPNNLIKNSLTNNKSQFAKKFKGGLKTIKHRCVK